MSRPILKDLQSISREKFLNTLAESYVLQDAILGATELSVISTNTNGVVNSFNAAASKLLGYLPNEVIGEKTPELWHDWNEIVQRSKELSAELGKTIEPGFETLIIKARLTRKADRREWTYIRKDGSRFPVTISISGIWNDHDELTGYLGIATDITEQKEADQKLHESEQKFRLLAENIPGVVYLCRNDTDYSMVYLNHEVEALTGYTADDFLSGKISFVQLYHPDDIDMINALVEKAIAKREKFHIQYRIRHKSGNWRWIDEVGIGVFSGNDLILLEGYLSDITDRKKFEEQLLFSKTNLEAAAEELQEQNHQLNEFAHIISHNLRSPVGNINALISLLDDKSSLQDYKNIFEKLKMTSSNLQDTLNDLMETLRIKKEKMADQMPLTFEEVFTKTVQDLAGEIMQSGAVITSDFSACPGITYSKTYLESIFLNLLSNALKYKSTKRIPEIHFKTEIKDGHVHLMVADNGLGLDLDKYGDKLFGLRKVFHEHKEARGVGLFLTRTQIETLGGKIWATSQVDKGSIFYVQF